MWGTSYELKFDYSSDSVPSDIICLHREFIPNDILNECDKYVPNQSNSSHIPDVILSDFGHSHNLVE